MKVLIGFLLIFAAVIAIPVDSPALSTIQANGEFARNLYKEVSQKYENLVISPASAHACLSMLYQGATGLIKEEFKKVLGVTSEIAAGGYQSIMNSLNSAKSANVTVANKIYIKDDRKLKQRFVDVVRSKFHSEVESIDFCKTKEAADRINKWVEEKTNNKIKNLLQESDIKDASLTLVNTVYFKSAWLHRFSNHSTKQEPFYLKDGQTEDVAMMNQVDYFPYKHDTSLDAKIVVLPHENLDFSMVIILPNNKNGLTELENKLNDIDLSQIAKGAEVTELDLYLPQFKFSTEMRLKDALLHIGLEDLFSPSDYLAGVIEETEEPFQLYVSQVIQKVFIHVDENGSEAAAATATVMEVFTTDDEYDPEWTAIEFRVDHPFIFIVTHQVGSQSDNKNILFYGKVEEPVISEL